MQAVDPVGETEGIGDGVGVTPGASVGVGVVAGACVAVGVGVGVTPGGSAVGVGVGAVAPVPARIGATGVEVVFVQATAVEIPSIAAKKYAGW